MDTPNFREIPMPKSMSDWYEHSAAGRPLTTTPLHWSDSKVFDTLFGQEEPYTSLLRRKITEQYHDHPTGCGSSFGEILCYEIHDNGLTFSWLAQKWGISLPTLGKLIADHCERLQELPQVNHDFTAPGA
jgi:hypothetical protein